VPCILVGQRLLPHLWDRGVTGTHVPVHRYCDAYQEAHHLRERLPSGIAANSNNTVSVHRVLSIVRGAIVLLSSAHLMPRRTTDLNPYQSESLGGWRPHCQPTPTSLTGLFPVRNRIGSTPSLRSRSISSPCNTAWTSCNTSSLRSLDSSAQPPPPPVRRHPLTHLAHKNASGTRPRAHVGLARAIRALALPCWRPPRCTRCIPLPVPVGRVGGCPPHLRTPSRASSFRLSTST
jgi:hypothetical protein